jgi:NAD(P)-dependent dehydrogenase (short-subunit alcohol dehydrogenase family)
MAKTTVITGSASGIGAAIRKRLEDEGDRVIGVDLVDAEILADLSGSEGRNAAVATALERCGGCLDRLVTCAGLGTHVRPPSLVASVNYFGAVDVLDGLFEALCKGDDPAVVVVVSNSAQMAPLDDSPYVKALLDHDEAEARRIVDEIDASAVAYIGSKHALGRAVRRRASKWGDARIRLNGVAPGPVRTPLLEGALDDPETGDAVRSLNVPIGRWGEPEEVAALVAFLLGPEAAWIHGSIYYIDGGNDAAIRPDRY